MRQVGTNSVPGAQGVPASRRPAASHATGVDFEGMATLGPMGSSEDDLYTQAVAAIENEYVRLGHARGWNFLNSPRRTLVPDAPVALLSMHPGGNRVAPGQPF